MIYLYEKIKDVYYDIKWTIINLFSYYKIVSKMRPWDYMYITEMMEFQLKLLHNSIKNGYEIDETRIIKENNIKRVLELLRNLHDCNYYERCGYIRNAMIYKLSKCDDDSTIVTTEHNPEYPDYDENDVFDKASKLETDEWNEIFDILKNDMRGWWS